MDNGSDIYIYIPLNLSAKVRWFFQLLKHRVLHMSLYHQERLVSITFSPDYRRIRRDPDTPEELARIFRKD